MDEFYNDLRIPSRPSSMEYTPGAWSIELFLETRRQLTSLTLFCPIFASDRKVSVGWSKLYQNTNEVFEELRRTRFPLSKSTTVVLLVVMLAWVDQMMVP
uniref:Uncharacterized protein n=1 Tax=Arundo donax TaxID=35708 RepID=A0A0A8YMK0_ARUDO